MNHKASPKNSDDLKTRIKKLVSFEEGKGLSGPSRTPPKYARVLTCTFDRGSEDPTRRQKKEPKVVHFPELTTKKEASIK
jgi:hypothetical protein